MNQIELRSEVEIPGWNCTFQQEGSGGGEWICHPPDDEIRPVAHKLWEHWKMLVAEEFNGHEFEGNYVNPEDPGPWHFWFEAEKYIIERFDRGHR